MPCPITSPEFYGKFSRAYPKNDVRNILNPDNSPTIDIGGMGTRKITCYANLDLPGAPGVSGQYFPANHYQANNLITLQSASNITVNAPIHVFTGAQYTFRAANSIDISGTVGGAGIDIDPGADVQLEIGSCLALRPTKDNDPEQVLISQLQAIGKLPVQKTFKNTNDHNIYVQTEQLKANIFPNPNRGNFKIMLSKNDNYTVIVQNVLGQVIFNQNYKKVNMIDVGLKNKTPGGYYIKISNAAQQLATKIFIQ